MKHYSWQRGLAAVIVLCLVCAAGALVIRLLSFSRKADRSFARIDRHLSSGIFARPLELHPGRLITENDLKLELKMLEYRRQSVIDSPGTYVQKGSRFTIFARGFHFEDGPRPSRMLRLTIRNKRLQQLDDAASGQSVKRFRLEPLRIDTLSSSFSSAYVPAEMMPSLLVKTLISVEDKRFFSHCGIDGMALLRAGAANLFRKGIAQGGSTLTQQLARQLFFSNRRRVGRKLNEILMAMVMEVKYSKTEILERYLNQIYLGQDGGRIISGFYQAARYYYQRDIRELGPPELAMLVGLLKGPSRYDPRRFPERARMRRNLVLKIMARNHLFDPMRLNRTLASPLNLRQDFPPPIHFPAVVDQVQREVKKKIPHEPLSVLRVFTTCDPIIQLNTENAVKTKLACLEDSSSTARRELEAGVVVVSTDRVELLAMVGGRHPRFRGFNRALDARRPIGSLIKPVYFLSALARPERYNLMTSLNDEPLELVQPDGRVWSPKNFTGVYHGSTPLLEVLTHSYNTAAVRLGMDAGLGGLQETMHQLKVESPPELYPADLLGALSFSPFKVADIYLVFSSGGRYRPISSVRSICRLDGSLLPVSRRKSRRIWDAGPVYLLNVALQRVISQGSAARHAGEPIRRLKAAGKSGTTNDLRDSWFAGFTGDTLSVVWLGSDDNQPVRLTGSEGAFRLWQAVVAGISHRPFAPKQPPGVVWVEIDPKSGLKIDEQGCGPAVSVPYIVGFQPRRDISCRELAKRDNVPFNQWMKETLR